MAGGIAYATIPDSNGVIHACYHVNPHGTVDGSGNLRVIDPASTNKDGSACRKDEKALDFDQTGPQGAKGQGRPGRRGQQGQPDNRAIRRLVGRRLRRGKQERRDGALRGDSGDDGDASCRELLRPGRDLTRKQHRERHGLRLRHRGFRGEYDYEDTTANTRDWATLPVQAVVTLASPDTISFECTARGRSQGLQLAAGRDQGRDGPLMRKRSST